MYSKVLVVLAYLSAAFAVPYITQPVASSSYPAGQNATLRWQDDGSEPTIAKYGPCSLSIYAGNSIQQTLLQTLNASVDISRVSEISFRPDASIGPNSGEYFIRIESISLKDPRQPQYPALAFSAKFTLTGMTGTFTAAVQSQIRGQSTAPLAGPTGSTSAVATSSRVTTTSQKASATTSSAASASKSTSAAIIGAQAGWASALLGALLSVTML